MAWKQGARTLSTFAIIFSLRVEPHHLRSRTILNPVLQSTMQQIAAQFSRQTAAQVANSTNISEILSNAPQLITQPVSYTLVNIRPFDVPVYAHRVMPTLR